MITSTLVLLWWQGWPEKGDHYIYIVCVYCPMCFSGCTKLPVTCKLVPKHFFHYIMNNFTSFLLIYTAYLVKFFPQSRTSWKQFIWEPLVPVFGCMIPYNFKTQYYSEEWSLCIHENVPGHKRYNTENKQILQLLFIRNFNFKYFFSQQVLWKGYLNLFISI